MEKPATGHPSAQVPEEIWREIFRLCANSRTGPATFNPLEAPVLLTHVCTQWRLIAHDEGKLWTSLRTHYPYPKPDEWHVQQLLDWLHRAKHEKVSLHLEQTYGDSEVSALFQVDAPVERFMPQVAEIANNLTNLVLIEISEAELASLPPDSFPNLESLVIPTKYWDHSQIVAFSEAPALRRVALGPQIADPGFIPLPWHQLTHLLEFEETFKRTWECLTQMTNIRYLAMMPPRPAKIRWEWPGQRAVINSLESLTVTLWDNYLYHGFQARGISFLNRFTFPNLKNLRLILSSELSLSTPLYWGVTQQFLEILCGYKMLEYFSLSCAYLNGMEILFEVIPTVRVLDVHLRNQDPEDLSALFEALTIVNDGPLQQHPLPHLRKFIVDLSTKNLCRSHRLDAAEPTRSETIILSLRNFLTSRLTEAGAIGEVFAIAIYGTDATLIQPYVSTLDDLVEAGLELEVNILPYDIERQECHCSRWWMYRDPELKDWKEVLEMARVPSC
ncbi:hypothetical protein MD484_g3674, partial [Candolleomyces efflorescens]